MNYIYLSVLALQVIVIFKQLLYFGNPIAQELIGRQVTSANTELIFSKMNKILQQRGADMALL